MTTDEFRQIRTADEEFSIWKDLKEEEFRTHLVELEQRTNAVPIDVRVFNVHEDLGDEGILPLRIEQNVADNFAFLTAVQEGAQSVAAVCLEQHFVPSTQLKLQVAAMDTLDERVKITLDGICKILKQVHVQYDCTDQLFKLIIAQHQNRILARLRSKKWTKPRYLAETHKKPLWQDFTNLVHRVQHIYESRREKAVRQQIEKELFILAKLYEDFESCPSEELQARVGGLVCETYRLCLKPHIRDFAMKLKAVRQTTQIGAAVKTLHQLEKIGAYFRIARDLTTTAITYPHWFGNITLEYLAPYASVPTEIAYEPWATACHVHAEVQLIVHYDLLKQNAILDNHEKGMVWPRTIGTSKYLCFLCYLFIKYHGQFFAANTHGRLYDQWTVPDLREYNGDLRESYAEILKQVDEEVRVIRNSNPTRQWRVEPMTSRQNLLSDWS